MIYKFVDDGYGEQVQWKPVHAVEQYVHLMHQQIGFVRVHDILMVRQARKNPSDHIAIF